MSLKERIYSVLAVSSAENFNSALCSLLPEAKYSPVNIVSSVGTAKRAISERDYDFIIINSPVHDDTGTRFAIDASGTANSVVLILIRSELHSEIHDKVAEYGIFTLPKPTSKPMLSIALGWLASARERMRKVQKKTLSIEEKMEEIRIVNRAKWLLISELKLDESEAHRYIEKQAMDECVSKRVIAENIIKTYT